MEEKKINSIRLTYDSQDYVLTFTKATIRTLERSGFSINRADDMPVTMMEMFIIGAFKARQPSIKDNKCKEIWRHIEDKQGLTNALMEIYKSQSDELMEEPEEDDSKKTSWVAE